MRFALRWIAIGFLTGCAIMAGWVFGEWLHHFGGVIATRCGL
jgi:hypothetical protein